ncbi:unnamed protein product [Rhizoctonia solani]|uniref:Zn(2)-C6 fungal-type domain-containing protein n=1 Tax=Rhizoctonia solani TaxID=456999 RepID=A0A8H3DIR6_9AGAM|nr:unnamed protein product [Rhizoctonia solani]
MKPGPIPKSCLTCRRRRKKCDLSKPCCERCQKGGYECLGYDSEPRVRGYQDQDDSTRPVPREDRAAQVPAQCRTRFPGVPTEGEALKSPDSATIRSSKNRQGSTDADTDYNPRPSILGVALLHRLRRPVPTDNNDRVSIDSTEDFDRSWPQDLSPLTVHSRSRTPQSSSTRRSFDAAFGAGSNGDDLRRIIQVLCRSIPPLVDTTQMLREDHLMCVINEYDIQRVSYWFTTPSSAIGGYVVAQSKRSKEMMWTIYLGARLFQALSRDSYGTVVQGCIIWIDRLERRFTSTSSNLPLDEIADRFMAQLELGFLKFSMVGIDSAYALCQKVLPWFLQLVAADEKLYIERPDGNLVVSFARTLSATRPELGRFVLYDTAAVFLFGVPPLVEYGYDGEWDSGSHELEWVHGVPVKLVEIISQINLWRAGSRTAPMNDWEAMERHILSWRPLPIKPGNEDSTAGSVARFAVQESWRHVVLIYLYMGMCGVSSHDSRVQASVHRIAELGQTVANLPIGIYMITHCVIAGLAARLERHRVLFHAMLQSFTETRVWLFRGPQLSQVLYHLWHGVGKAGAPVMWDDYVRSSCTVIQI